MAELIDKATLLRASSAVQDYLAQEMEVEASQLQCQLLLDFLLHSEFGTALYHGALQDAQQQLQRQLEDLPLYCLPPAERRRN
ncbi:DUF2164 family protein [Chitinibacter tainanensis]|uniref:DUF2164 family protein n=1 Tax=Chitinibacter tainanensis TaxID=230667 RepID=UPI00235468D0|nr:DUF2164 family protein [Chitinibacter tainanensis]